MKDIFGALVRPGFPLRMERSRSGDIFVVFYSLNVFQIKFLTTDRVNSSSLVRW
jgi:hypothetical protein